MSPSAELEMIDTAPPARDGVDVDARTRFFIQLLTEAFGDCWHANDDPRYREELGYRPVDVVLPLHLHPEAIEKAMTIERRLLTEYRTNVSVFVIAPEEEPEAATA